MPRDERRAGPRSTPPPAFTRAETGRDDETWRALPQWRSVPALRLGSDSDETEAHVAAPPTGQTGPVRHLRRSRREC